VGNAIAIIIIGTGGIGTSSGNNGGNTSITINNMTYTANGGVGVTGIITAGAGIGGSGGVGPTFNGQSGADGTDVGTLHISGKGGDSQFGYGGYPVFSGIGKNGINYGGGGSGGANGSYAGGNGSPGVAIIEW